MKKSFFALIAAALVMIFTGCNKTNDGPGRLVVKITDAPFPIDMVESASVTITKVELRKEGAGVNDASGFSVVWEGSETFNLLDLRNGLTAELTDVEIPQGSYDLVRLYVDQAELKIKDGGTFNVDVPSGPQTGIKVFISPGIVVEGGLTSELVLDFDLAGSFVMMGTMDSPTGITGFTFKPVIKAINNTTQGNIEGTVTEKGTNPVVNLDNVSISVKQGDIEIKSGSTLADGKGFFLITGLEPGLYSVTASLTTYDPVTKTDITVVAGNKTVVNFELTKTQTTTP